MKNNNSNNSNNNSNVSVYVTDNIWHDLPDEIRLMEGSFIQQMLDGTRILWVGKSTQAHWGDDYFEDSVVEWSDTQLD